MRVCNPLDLRSKSLANCCPNRQGSGIIQAKPEVSHAKRDYVSEVVANELHTGKTNKRKEGR